MSKPDADLPYFLVGLFSTGRAGSNFLGTVINAHADVAYRSEPFHRLPHLSAEDYMGLLGSGRGDQARKLLIESLVPAPSTVEKPPQFKKRRRPSRLPYPVYLTARKLALVDRLYGRYLRARPGETIAFKEVTHERLMSAIALCNAFPVSYLIRHPVGVCISLLRGQEAGKMPMGRQMALTGLLADHRPDLLARFGSRLEEMSLFERNLILWRFDTERAWEAATQTSRVHVVIYEVLCEQLFETTECLLRHFDLDLDDGVASFLGSLSVSNHGRHEMFGVQKDPASVAWKWREQASSEQLRQAAGILDGSPWYEKFTDSGEWPSV